MANSPGQLKVKIFSPYRVYYQGDAVSVSAKNKVGAFDILPQHTNFLSLLTSESVTVDTGFEVYKFPVGRGILKVNKNTVTLFAGL